MRPFYATTIETHWHCLFGRHDIHHNDTQLTDIYHNNAQHDGVVVLRHSAESPYDDGYYYDAHYAECHYAKCHYADWHGATV